MHTQPSAAFPFESKFVTVDNHKIHYIDEGSGDPVLFIHGNPTSSYLWRNILPNVARESGTRGIAPDLLGFGKSDKPDIQYTADLFAKIIEGFIEQLALKNVTLVLHDWGGPIGGFYAARHPDNVKGIVLMETFLWPMKAEDFGKFRAIFSLFRSPVGYLMIQVFNMFVNGLLPGSVVHKDHMSEEVMRHYREPFPTVASRRAIWAFPKLIPIDGSPKESLAFVASIISGLRAFHAPALLIRARPGVIVNTDEKVERFRRALPQLTIKEFGDGLHYIQEDDPEKISRLIIEWMREEHNR